MQNADTARLWNEIRDDLSSLREAASAASERARFELLDASDVTRFGELAQVVATKLSELKSLEEQSRAEDFCAASPLVHPDALVVG
jgi:hypothetical protein